MGDERARELIECGDRLFSKRRPLLTFWQDVAENFYPERADFTVTRSIGYDFASDLMTSYPLLARRDLGNSFGAMLRPTSVQWFKMTTGDDDRLSGQGRAWLQWATNTLRKAMYARQTGFTRATKEGDHDFAAFGQCVISVELNRNADDLLYRSWHLRDVVWCDDETGQISEVHCEWKPTKRMLKRMFKRVAAEVDRAKDDYAEFKCRRIVVPADEYDYKTDKPWVSIHLDVANKTIMEEVGVWVHPYVIPRWQTVSGTQYAHSPATVAALPEARLIQAVTRVLLEAGEKYANPPMLATGDAIRGDINLYAGGITIADAVYDERMGDVLRPITSDKSGFPVVTDMREDLRAVLAECFYSNKLSMPPSEREMTAFEMAQRVQEYIRQALPIFEPVEGDYNGALCERSMEVGKRAGLLGPTRDIPDELQDAEVSFQFMSPMREAIEQTKVNKFMQAFSLISQAVAADPNFQSPMDVTEALYDALRGADTPEKWFKPVEEIEQAKNEAEMNKQAQMLLSGGQQAADITATLAGAMPMEAAA